MIEISPEPKAASRWKSPVLITVVSVIVAGAATAAASQIPALARALTWGRFAALGATIGLGVSIASLVAGALFVRGPVAANAVKFGSMALMVVSLGILVGGCELLSSPSMSNASGSLGGYASGSMNTTLVTVSPAATTISTAKSLSVTISVNTLTTTGTFAASGTVVLSSGTYNSGTLTLCGPNTAGCAAGTFTTVIPAGSLAPGTDTLTAAFTPAKGDTTTFPAASGTAMVAVTAPALVTPTVTAAPSSASITTLQPLSVTVTVSGGGANATPTGSVMLTSGAYTSPAPPLVNGTATIPIAAGSLATGTDTLSVFYTPDANSSALYNSSSGTASVTVTLPPPTTPAMTLALSASSITTAQSLIVTVTLTGTGATPTGAVVLTGGGYASASMDLTAGSATIDIPTGSLNQGLDTLTVNYTPDANSSTIYDSTTATAQVTVTSIGVTPVALNNPNGLAIDSSNRLYVANSGGSQVLVYTETLNGSNIVTGLTQVATITTNISSPTRLAFDALGYLYVTNLGNNTVTVYDTSFNPVPSGTISNGISRPLGIAVDQTGDVYVGNNNANNITVYTGTPNAGFTLSATLTEDNSADQFLAPGDITFAKVAGVNELFVGVGPGGGINSVFVYPAPLRAGSDPATSLTNQSCPTGPNGPTGVATNSAGSTIYITSYYNSSVAEYTFTGIQTGNGCPAPTSTSGGSSLVAKPEGVAIDSSGNVFVSNSSANTITVYNTINSSPVYIQQ